MHQIGAFLFLIAKILVVYLMEAAKQPNEVYIRRALEFEQLLTIIEFIKVVNYPIDNFMINKFWACIKHKQYIYADDDLVRWMGYSGAEVYSRKIAVMRLLPAEEYMYLTHNEYINFLDNLVLPICISNIYPRVPTINNVTNIKHLLLTSKCLRFVMIRTNTPRENLVREYYFALEELFELYDEYQNKYATKNDRLMLEKVQSQLFEYDLKLEEKIRSQTTQLEREKEQALIIARTAEEKMKEQELIINYYKSINKGLTFYKKFIGRDEELYILTSDTCAPQYLFKISRAIDDSLIIVMTYKTHSSEHLEMRVHHLLQHYRCANDQEWFNISIDAIQTIIELADNHYHEEQMLINRITDINNTAQLQNN